ncbi:MAG: SDR family NAD(P)-dependent oxidoreductase [Puniceicoccaceae bacterium]|nr:MAG: SDR family NAD(P)-dependent oxidoreductase [Puniceicoccaceae bacterium]
MSDRIPRRALVTGGRTGLGRAVCHRLVEGGLKVLATTRQELPAPEPTLRWLRCDLEAPGAPERLWGEVEAATGGEGVDLLVNNAGFGIFSPAAGPDAGDALRRQAEVLFHAPAALVRLALPGMMAKGRGWIVNVTSLAAEFPIPMMGGYAGAKAALCAWTAALEVELADSGIKLIDFRPGDYRTDFNQAMASISTDGSADPRAAAVWRRLEHHLANGPPPERAARDLWRALERGRGGVVRSGSFAQARLAPLLARLVPQRLVRRCQRAYYGL